MEIAPPPLTVAQTCTDQADPRLCEVDPCFHGTLASCGAACTAATSAAACETFGHRVCQEGTLAACDTACDAGNAEACRSLAHLYAEGARGLTQDVDSTLKLLRRACDLGGRRTCPVFEQPDGARSPLEDAVGGVKSCELGGVPACKELGNVYLRGSFGETKDEERASQYYELACDPAGTRGPARGGAGEAGTDACTAFAATDRAKAAALFHDSCVGGNPGACSFAAQMGEEDKRSVVAIAAAAAAAAAAKSVVAKKTPGRTADGPLRH